MKKYNTLNALLTYLILGTGFACQDNPISAGTQLELQPVEGIWSFDPKTLGDHTGEIESLHLKFLHNDKFEIEATGTNESKSDNKVITGFYQVDGDSLRLTMNNDGEKTSIALKFWFEGDQLLLREPSQGETLRLKIVPGK